METVINIRNEVEKIKLTGWSAIGQSVKDFVRYVMETVLTSEQYEQIGCKPYERTENRIDYTNGSYKRTLSTSYGFIDALKIPRLRNKVFRSLLIKQYKRRTLELDKTLLAWYLQGESCRDVTRSLTTWSQDIISAQTVSKIIQSVDHKLLEWRQRQLPSDLDAVWLDGFSVKVRVKQKVRSYVILTALGRHSDGRWEVLSFRLAESESERKWAELLCQMHRRGMRTKLFVHDGAGGIAQALRWDYPNVPTQRCLVHKLRNILDVISSEEHRKQIKNDFWYIYGANTVEQATDRLKWFSRKWHYKEPKAVSILCDDYRSTFTYLNLNGDLRIICRSTNMIELMHRELRRRVKVISAFPNPYSSERIIFITLLYIENINLNKSGNMLSLMSEFTQN
jgi:transposase-like protein